MAVGCPLEGSFEKEGVVIGYLFGSQIERKRTGLGEAT